MDSVQTPDEYEGENGEKLQAIPTGRRESNPFVPTGVELSMTVHTSVPVEIKAVTTQEIEAKQQEEEAKKQEEALQALEATLTKHEEEAKKQEKALQALEATLKKQEEALKKAEEHTKQVGEEAKKHEEELNAQITAIKKHQEEEAAKKKQEESKPPTRAQLLSKALAQCKKKPQSKRAHCMAEATKKYGHKAKTGKK